MPDVRYAALARRFGDALRVGDPAQADRVVDDALAALAPPDAVQSLVIAPAMARIGGLWEAGIISVAEEHLATAICQRALVRLYAAMSAKRSGGPRRETVLLAAIDGQSHVMGLQMVADVLDAAGFDVLYLGGDVPVEDLRDLVEARRPSVVGLSFGIAPQTSRMADAMLAVHDASLETRLMIGGSGVPVGLRQAGYPWVANSMEVVQTVEELLDGPPQVVPEILAVLASHGTADEETLRETATETDAIAEQFARVVADASDVVRDHIRTLADDGSTSSAGGPSRDPLTGLLARSAFLEWLHGFVGTTEVAGAVLIIDVDDLRAVNEVHGRQVGDVVLGTVAGVVRRALRPEDVLARTGGNEFMAVLPEATQESAERVAEQVRIAVSTGTTPRVTVSAATTGLMSDPRAVLLAASTALCTAKATRQRRLAAADAGNVGRDLLDNAQPQTVLHDNP